MADKKPYETPQLTRYRTLTELTKTGASQPGGDWQSYAVLDGAGGTVHEGEEQPGQGPP